MVNWGGVERLREPQKWNAQSIAKVGHKGARLRVVRVVRVVRRGTPRYAMAALLEALIAKWACNEWRSG